MKYAKTSFALKALVLSGVISGIAACGGGGGGSGDAIAVNQAAGTGSTGNPPPASSDQSQNTLSPTQDPQLILPSSALPVLNLPARVANGEIVSLQCGRIYRGSLDLSGRSNVTVRTDGDCGKAVISPGRAVEGWTRHDGNIWSAPIDFSTAQVILDGQPLELAHWPSRTQTWAQADSSTTTSLKYAMPSSDLAGATLLFKPYEWAVEARRITGYADGSMALATSGNPNYDGYPLQGRVPFYVEGKLWMLDEPGEWAQHDGRLYVWASDGQSPQGRAWVAPDLPAINAANSSAVSIEGIAIYGAADAIYAADASRLQVRNVDIANASGNGIMNSGGSLLEVDGGSIRNVRHDAIAVKWGGGGERIRNVRIDRAGSIGMPANAHAAINLTVGVGSQVSGNTVSNSGYIGIRTFRDSVVSGNVVDGACLVLTDCGGIFNSARDGLPLNARIEGNTVSRVGVNQRLAWGIYLGDGANGLEVIDNTVSGSGNGMLLYDGHDVVVRGNTFSDSTQAHIQMHETAANRILRNSIAENVFVSRNGDESYRLSSDAGTAALSRFGTWNGNQYRSSSQVFANYNGEALSYTQWRQRTGQDGASSFGAP